MTRIQTLYDRIPPSKCKPGCHACCSNLVQMAPEESERMGGYAYKGVCPHLVDGGCSVYEARPMVCRLFGVSEIMPCEDCKPDRYLSAEDTKELLRDYLAEWKAQERE